jgi:2-iminobutanoate/2-iminopropanoate deaminase
MRRAINDVPNLAPAAGPYSRAVWAGDFLYLSGQTGASPETGKLVEGGVAAETKQVFENLGAVLKAAGLSFDHVIKCNVYLIDMADFSAMNTVYAGYFQEPRPGRTTVAVAALPGGAKVEIEVVAYKG